MKTICCPICKKEVASNEKLTIRKNPIRDGYVLNHATNGNKSWCGIAGFKKDDARKVYERVCPAYTQTVAFSDVAVI